MSEKISLVPTIAAQLDEAGGRALVEAWRTSGLSGAAFCRAHDIRIARLHYWRERLGYPIKVISSSRSVKPNSPVADSAPPSHGFVQMVMDPPTTSHYVDIFVDGIAVRVHPQFDASLLRSVVSALRKASSHAEL